MSRISDNQLLWIWFLISPWHVILSLCVLPGVVTIITCAFVLRRGLEQCWKAIAGSIVNLIVGFRNCIALLTVKQCLKNNIVTGPAVSSGRVKKLGRRAWNKSPTMEPYVVADLHSKILDARPLPPPGAQILSISCSFWEFLAKSYVGAPRELEPPPRGNPGSATGMHRSDSN